MSQATFRFYEELNDFLPEDRRKSAFTYEFSGTPSIKDAVEALGVPHPEIDLLIVNGCSVDFSYRLKQGDRVTVYPMFESVDITPLVRLQQRPLRTPRFIADVHLRRLARWLRLLGFDTLHSNEAGDSQIVESAAAQSRIILTRDRQLLKRRAVDRGYWVRSVDPMIQVREVLRRFDLYTLIAQYQRCMACNGRIRPVAKHDVIDRIPPRTAAWIETYFECESCGKVYWKGTHAVKLDRLLRRITASEAGSEDDP